MKIEVKSEATLQFISRLVQCLPKLRNTKLSNLQIEKAGVKQFIRFGAIRAKDDLGTLNPAMERELGSDPGITIFANSG